MKVVGSIPGPVALQCLVKNPWCTDAVNMIGIVLWPLPHIPYTKTPNPKLTHGIKKQTWNSARQQKCVLCCEGAVKHETFMSPHIFSWTDERLRTRRSSVPESWHAQVTITTCSEWNIQNWSSSSHQSWEHNWMNYTSQWCTIRSRFWNKETFDK